MNIKEPTLRWPCVASTGRPSFSQVRLGGGTPLETHSRLMGWLRTTERSAGPVVRMDGETRERIERMRRSNTSPWLLEKVSKSGSHIYPTGEPPSGLR